MLIRIVSFVTEISDTAIIRYKGQGRYPSENSSIKAYRETNYRLIKNDRLLDLPAASGEIHVHSSPLTPFIT